MHEAGCQADRQPTFLGCQECINDNLDNLLRAPNQGSRPSLRHGPGSDDKEGN